MGFADGFYYGQGKIIVDTTNLLATDVVRVRSMTTPTKVWNKTVTTPGGYMVFEVPGKDYYKISLVRDVDDTPTEIVSASKTVDYGQTIYIDEFDSKELETVYYNIKGSGGANGASTTDSFTADTDGFYDITFIGSQANKNEYYADQSISLTHNGTAVGTAKSINQTYGGSGSTFTRALNYSAELRKGDIINATFSCSTYSGYGTTCTSLLVVVKSPLNS